MTTKNDDHRIHRALLGFGARKKGAQPTTQGVTVPHLRRYLVPGTPEYFAAAPSHRPHGQKGQVYKKYLWFWLVAISGSQTPKTFHDKKEYCWTTAVAIHSNTYSLQKVSYYVKYAPFGGVMLFSGGQGLFLTISAAGSARGPSLQYDAYVDPGRAP